MLEPDISAERGRLITDNFLYSLVTTGTQRPMVDRYFGGLLSSLVMTACYQRLLLVPDVTASRKLTPEDVIGARSRCPVRELIDSARYRCLLRLNACC